MKVLLINPPFLENFSRSQRSPAVTKSGTLYFPMWLSYAAGVLEQEGHEIDFIDAPADCYEMDSVVERCKKFKPDLFVLDTSTPSIYNDVSIAGKLKDLLPASFIILVGTHVSALPRETMDIDERIDAVAVREYDYTLRDLARTIENNGSLKEVSGILYRENGKIVENEKRLLIENLDDIPFVSNIYKKFLRIENYFNPNALYPMVTITTSRGCPFQCTFCIYPQTLMGRGLRLRNINSVVDEMEFIVKNFPQAKAIFFEDDTLTVSKKRCVELSEMIIKRGIKISWSANARVGLDTETMSVMKKAGCRSLCVGFESGSQVILDNMRKNTKLDVMHDFMKDAKRAGILIHGCFMAGLPGETKDTMRQTLELAKALNPDTVQFYPVMVYPGTEAYDWYKSRGFLVTEDFSRWITPLGLHNTVVQTGELSPEELVKFCDNARREFYLRPMYILYKTRQMMLHPEEIKRTVKSARTFIKHLFRGSDIE
jgi:radical SAM superfamily enzyme YgiQ (UPF0313 family)